jgi:hypothetical protein
MRPWTIVLAALMPTAAAAQQVMAPPRAEAPLDSAAQYYRGLLVVLRDTVNAVAARAHEFRRDLPSAGDVTVLSKAARLAGTCAAARAALDDALPAVSRAAPTATVRPARDSLRAAIRRLSSGLDRECITGLAGPGPGARADTLRAWGRYRTGQLAHLITLYHSAAAQFGAALGFKLPPPVH